MQYKYIILGTIAGIVLVGQARAQDRWAGGYWGLSLDGIEAEARVGNSSVHKYKDDHVSLGGYAGYNFVRDTGLVWGPEVSLHGVSSGGSASDAALGDSGFEGSFVLATKLRAGWATDQVFFYGTLGLEMSDVRAKPATSTSTDLSISVSAGIGVEYAITDTWSTRLEVSQVKYDAAKSTFNGTSQDLTSSIGRVSIGLSRKF